MQLQRDQNGFFPAAKEEFQAAGYETALKIFQKGTSKGGTTYGAATHEQFVQSGICQMMHDHQICFTEGGRYVYSWKDYKKQTSPGLRILKGLSC
ncbi:MAG: hypothetical protein Q8O92_06145 [Candidatus Latescibacter sp.]|nr:hypothetical protein [Candidatus Latescibacter sp.]